MSSPIVCVKNGKLKGEILKNYDNYDYYSFKGIPYAKPPTGTMRFKAPMSAEPWEGIKDATEHGNCCLNFNTYNQTFSGSDDCLYLNVYTRELPNPNSILKPVMVSIHGGGFTTGSGNTDLHGPEFLMTKDIVIVTFNYRLGLLGFLNLDDCTLDVPGNAGMKDQVLALKWVQENIACFSGDPKNVTIFGISAGGASVHYLMLSPLAEGLFHKCIMQSGCVFAPWAKGHKTLPFLAEALEKQNINEKEILEILQNMSSDELLKLQTKMSDNFDPSHRRHFAPVVEKASPGAFLSEEPEKIIRSGNYNQVPMIIGFTSREGLFLEFYSDDAKNNYVVKNFQNIIPCTWNIPRGSSISKKVAENIKHFYYHQQAPGKENASQYYLMIGDALFQWPVIKSVKTHIKTSHAPIYLYRFTADSRLNIVKKFLKSSSPGASHGDDGFYLFNTTMSPSITPNSLEENIIKSVITLWTNFASYSSPNSSSSDSIDTINWLPVEKYTLHFLEIGDNFTIGENPDGRRMNFWEEISANKFS